MRAVLEAFGKITVTSPFVNMTSLSYFFEVFVFLFFKFSYWSKFHVNIITGSVATTTFVYKGLTRSPEIKKNPVLVLSNIYRLGKLGIKIY